MYHNIGLIISPLTPIGPEGSLPFISIFHSDIVKSLTYIKFGEVPGSLQLIDEFRDEQEWVLVFDGDCI